MDLMEFEINTIQYHHFDGISTIHSKTVWLSVFFSSHGQNSFKTDKILFHFFDNYHTTFHFTYFGMLQRSDCLCDSPGLNFICEDILIKLLVIQILAGLCLLCIILKMKCYML
jgi:hypothetical protein